MPLPGVSGTFSQLSTVPGSILELLAAATVITLVMLQDPIPGVRQDWLVRPIVRRDLFLAKLLFVILLVQGPWWLTDVLQGLANGFSVSQSAAAATSCALWVLLTLSVPVLAFAALATTMTETLMGALAVLAILIAFLIVPALVGANDQLRSPHLGASYGSVVARRAGVIVQYRWRSTVARAALPRRCRLRPVSAVHSVALQQLLATCSRRACRHPRF
jgi:hypothetical protein